MRVILILLCIVMVAACGGGGGGGSSIETPTVQPEAPEVITPTPPTGDLATGYTFPNPKAIDPLASIRAMSLPQDSQMEYEVDTPTGSPVLNPVVFMAPDTNIPWDFWPMVHRAFKLWSRRVESILDIHRHDEHGADGVSDIHISIGYERDDGTCLTACANHSGGTTIPPADRPNAEGTPSILFTPRYFARRTGLTGSTTSAGFATIAHEFGHVFNFLTEEGEVHETHCLDGVLMCDHSSVARSIAPTDQDFDGIRHHYELRDHSDHEQFGIWASPPEGSGLERFGVEITRSLVVAAVRGADIGFHQDARNFMTDHISVRSSVEGTAGSNPSISEGTATWSGDLIGVDIQHFQPVFGDATLSMDLSTADQIQASFTGVRRSDETGKTYRLPDLAYSMISGANGWGDIAGRINARFYGEDTVGGHIHDLNNKLIGAFGALRDE